MPLCTVNTQPMQVSVDSRADLALPGSDLNAVADSGIDEADDLTPQILTDQEGY